MNVWKRAGMAGLVVGLTLCWLSSAGAEAKAKGDATGTWKSSFKTSNGRTIETTFKLKQDGTKLTGTVIGRDGKEVMVEEGKAADGKVSFQVTREFNNQKFTIKYHGKVEGDTIKGKLELPGRDNNVRMVDWVAKRQK
jgi:hypothetical protein